MAPVGPQMPPSTLDKRKRRDDEDESKDEAHSNSSSESETGPVLPPQSSESAPKRSRVIGPSLPPPTFVNQATAAPDESSESSDDDDFGPNLPPTGAKALKSAATTSADAPQLSPVHTTTVKRDDWMMVPPSGGDWTGRVDPTKLKNRKFHTGKGAKGPSSSGGDAANSWHETPQEKQVRLQREMMGIKGTSTQPTLAPQSSPGKVDAETARRLQEYNKLRGPTLYEAHQKTETVEKDDDPSARAFDREKDIGGGLQINATQRRDMLKRAADFSTRFSSAKYL